jgi:hypothetical protein
MTPDGVSPAAARRLAAMGTKMPNPAGGRATGNIVTQRPRVSRPTAPRTPVKTNSRGNYARPAAPPAGGPGPVPNIEAYLGQDAGYQQQLREFAAALNDFTADATRRRGSLESEYGLSSKALADQRVKDLGSLEEDYGSRGLLRSGLYGDAVGDYETEYGQRTSDLSRRQNEALAALTGEQGSFSAQQKLKEQAAKEAAIRRRAEQFGA